MVYDSNDVIYEDDTSIMGIGSHSEIRPS